MKKKDQLTPFLARELLYDYAKGNLGKDRKSAVDEVLKNDADLKLELRNLELKLKELSSFEKVAPTESWIKDLSLPHPSLTQQIASLERRFTPRFWKALPLVILGAAVVMAVVLLKPWKMVSFKEVEVAQVSMSDDDIRMEAALALSEKDIESVMRAQAIANKEEEDSSASEKTPTQESQTVVEEKEPEKKKMGELYRGFMTVDNLIDVSDKTVSRIKELGGRKAGQVPLGWERDTDERYFHFSLPEKNKKTLLEFLSNFSQVRLSSQPHPLVMPEGKIRIILVVRQNPNAQPPPPEDHGQEETPPSEKEETSP